MQAEQLAQMFDRPTREGSGWRARCPVHKSKALTLGIYPKADRSIVVCYAGCSSDEILKAVGLTWKDTIYQRLDSRAWREAQRVRRLEEAKEYRGRIRKLVARFTSEGYTTRERDTEVACATALIMAMEGPKPHLQKILAVHMERITAANLLRIKA